VAMGGFFFGRPPKTTPVIPREPQLDRHKKSGKILVY
jgi:hypothetical protein